MCLGARGDRFNDVPSETLKGVVAEYREPRDLDEWRPMRGCRCRGLCRFSAHGVGPLKLWVSAMRHSSACPVVRLLNLCVMSMMVLAARTVRGMLPATTNRQGLRSERGGAFVF